MSLSNSRRSSKMREDGEFYLECKAAYLTEFDDIHDKIESMKALVSLLQTTGRNPTRTTLNKYWTSNTSSLSFNDFVDICNKEPATTADDLMKAFRKIDINGDGYISLDELYKIMSKKDGKMTREDVRKMIDEVDDNKDGRLDYREQPFREGKLYYGEFTNMVMKTTEDSKKMSKKVMERKERKKKRGELSAAKSDMGNNSDPINTHTAIKTGSQISLQSNRKVLDKDDPDQIVIDHSENIGSSASLRSNKRGSKTSAKNTSNKDNQGSSLSLQKQTNERLEGSMASIRSETHAKTPDDVKASRASFDDEDDDIVVRSKTSIRSAVRESKTPREKGTKQGSQVSLASTLKEGLDVEPVTDTSKRRESVTSQRSQSSKQEEVQSSPKNTNLDSMSIRPMTPRSKLGIPSIGDLERPGSSYSNRDSARSGASNTSQTLFDMNISANSTTKDVEAPSPFKLDIPKDSARSVGEEIADDDDFDIVSTGRPTPRVSLSSRTATPKTETPRSAKNESSAQNKEGKDDTDMGSQSSLKSGDKEGGLPVPSPRKSVPRGLEDEVPRPSPRVRSSKTKSPSSSLRSKDRLPDPHTLQDWSYLSSKGCFFYEEDEIVSHVYNLKLHDDSTVYLSTAPITKEPKSLNLPGSEPVDTALYVFDSRGNVVTFTEQRDVEGTFGVKLELSAGEYQILPYTTGCRFKQRGEMSGNKGDAKLVKKDKDGNVTITTAFRNALEDIFTLCDLDGNGLMSKAEFNWFNVRTSGEELGDDEWAVVEEKIDLEDKQIRKDGFIELNVMEAEDAEGDVEDLWITLTSMGMNKSLVMDEACPYRLNVYVKEVGRKKPRLTVTGIESLEKREFVTGICQSLIEKAGDPTSVRNMKDLYLYTYKNDYRATMVIDNRSRSTVQLEIDCTRSRNVVSNRSGLDHTFEIDPQQTAIAHHLMPKSELNDWSVVSSETIHK